MEQPTDSGPSPKNSNDSQSSSSVSKGVPGDNLPLLILPEMLHCQASGEILVEHDCVDKALLTRRNLTNPVGIQASTLFRHAKEVEANCKKALAICLAEDSPYRNYNGIFPNGTNRGDHLLWLHTSSFVTRTNNPPYLYH